MIVFKIILFEEVSQVDKIKDTINEKIKSNILKEIQLEKLLYKLN